MAFEEFLHIFREILELDSSVNLRPNSKLTEFPQWDSLAFLKFVVHVEFSSDIVLSPSELRACRTLDDLFNLASRRIN